MIVLFLDVVFRILTITRTQASAFQPDVKKSASAPADAPYKVAEGKLKLNKCVPVMIIFRIIVSKL